ncbi:hypothetical protein GCM10010399_88300 [Dactylosporangium fulvum]
MLPEACPVAEQPGVGHVEDGPETEATDMRNVVWLISGYAAISLLTLVAVICGSFREQVTRPK